MRTLNKTLLLIALISLGGCATTGTQIAYKNVLISPPDEFLADCPIAPPPNKNDFKAAKDQDKINMLAELSDNEIKNLDNCNKVKAKLRQWKKDQEAVYNGSGTATPTGAK